MHLKLIFIIFLLPLFSFAKTKTSFRPYMGRMGHTKNLFGYYPRAQVLNSSDYNFRIVGNIIIDDASFCTGTLIGQNVVLTAAHCVYDQNQKKFYDDIRFAPAQTNVSSAPFGYTKVLRTFIPTKYTTETNFRKYDYAVMELDQNIGENLGWAGVEVVSQNMNYNSTIIGYPGDKEDGTLWSVSCPVTISDDLAMVKHNCDTFGGMSGSAIRKVTSLNMIYGIHAFGNSNYNGGTAISQENFNYINAWRSGNTYGDTLAHQVVFKNASEYVNIYFTNKCLQVVDLYFEWLDLDSVWKMGHVQLNPNQSYLIGKTQNKIYYFKAQGQLGATWSGDHKLTFNSESFDMIQKEITLSNYGFWPEYLTCE